LLIIWQLARRWMELLVQVCSGVNYVWYVLECQWRVELWNHIVGDVLSWWSTVWRNDRKRGLTHGSFSECWNQLSCRWIQDACILQCCHHIFLGKKFIKQNVYSLVWITTCRWTSAKHVYQFPSHFIPRRTVLWFFSFNSLLRSLKCKEFFGKNMYEWRVNITCSV